MPLERLNLCAMYALSLIINTILCVSAASYAINNLHD